MSGQLRHLRKRIRSVENTKKITRAMEMVSAARLHRYQGMLSDGKTFAEELENVLRRVSCEKSLCQFHPFLTQREEKKVGLLLITSDTGLCGSYNSDLSETALQFIKTCQKPITLLGAGKLGIRFLELVGYSFYKTFAETRMHRFEHIILEIEKTLEHIYSEEAVDSIYVIYSRLVSAGSYVNTTAKLLPFEERAADETKTPRHPSADYIFEPDRPTITRRLVPLFFQARVRQIFLEAFVSEQLARMRAMHLATKNATDMVKTLVRQRNKARQATITKELIEVVSGSEALEQ